MFFAFCVAAVARVTPSDLLRQPLSPSQHYVFPFLLLFVVFSSSFLYISLLVNQAIQVARPLPYFTETRDTARFACPTLIPDTSQYPWKGGGGEKHTKNSIPRDKTRSWGVRYVLDQTKTGDSNPLAQAPPIYSSSCGTILRLQYLITRLFFLFTCLYRSTLK